MNDETLTLYFYNDGLSDVERHEVERALSADRELAARYEQLRRELSAFRIDSEPPLSADMRARFHDTIERAARLERARQTPARSPLHVGSFFWGAAITAALAIGIGIGAWFGNGQLANDPLEPSPVVDIGPAPTSTPVAFERRFTNFLRNSEREIELLPVDNSADRTTLILRLIEQNRWFETAASHNDAPQLARVLRAFEPILVELAVEDLSPDEVKALRDQLEFEMSVMLTKLENQSSNKPVNTEERT